MAARYGIIGAGMMAQEHIKNLQLIDGAVVTAIADPVEEMRMSAGRLLDGPITLFSNHSDLISADLCDAYVIATPNHTHHGILLDTLPTNKPVLVEKPLCTNSDECRSFVSKSQYRTAPVWVAMEYRYMPPIKQLQRRVVEGKIGKPIMMSVREHRYPFLPKVGNWNRFNNNTGGTLVEKCCHFWDLMRLILRSDPIRIYASGSIDVNHLNESYDGKTPDIIDNAYAIVDFENGTRAMLDLCMFAEGAHWQEEISVTGPSARIDALIPRPARFDPQLKDHPSRIQLSNRMNKKVVIEDVEIDEKILGAGDHHGATYYQHKRFFELVCTGSVQPEVTMEDGLWTVLMGEAAERSISTGKSQRIIF